MGRIEADDGALGERGLVSSSLAQTVIDGATAESTAAKKSNDALRAKYKHQVFTGEITAIDYIRAAVTDHRLRRQSLVQLLSSEEQISYRRAKAIVRAAFRYVYPDEPINFREMTVDWLVNDWSKGRRWEAFCMAYCRTTHAQGHAEAPYYYGEVSFQHE